MHHPVSPSWTSHVALTKPEEIFRMPGMYKLCQLSAVFSSRFLGRTLDKKIQKFFLLPTQFGHCINGKKKINVDHGSPPLKGEGHVKSIIIFCINTLWHMS